MMGRAWTNSKFTKALVGSASAELNTIPRLRADDSIELKAHWVILTTLGGRSTL